MCAESLVLRIGRAGGDGRRGMRAARGAGGIVCLVFTGRDTAIRARERAATRAETVPRSGRQSSALRGVLAHAAPADGASARRVGGGGSAGGGDDEAPAVLVGAVAPSEVRPGRTKICTGRRCSSSSAFSRRSSRVRRPGGVPLSQG
ncbi:hypothetical protein BDA96_10G278700 [Sorghum bicolor]|uniref:Uncharacterized protein n=2 Tax=Sorghum bicolor TaxID=4558 RepID=A0A921Q7P3_SORBI|nr:hypothetical protein BDA96_10G278700 [Sorghum bicolor]KXG20515.1 hypothetical protein SORBI_3010G214300 [Sorghum bicolor]